MKQQSIVTNDQNGVRLDAFLKQQNEEFTRSRIQNLIEKGCVTVNGKIPQKAGLALKTGDCVEMEVPESTPVSVQAEDIPVPIVYEDASIVVVNKPRGLVVHPAAGHQSGTLVNALLYQVGDLSGINGELRPGIVHRLDMDTTGLLVVAKNDKAHNSLAEQFKTRQAGRIYEALVEGHMKDICGTVDRAIARHPTDRKKMAVSTHPGAKNAVTDWRVLQEYAKATLVECSLRTGRTHQIRVHMASLGHPVCGDPIYGMKNSPVKAGVLMLHARQLHILHPETGEEMTFEAERPTDFEEVLSRLAQ